MITTPSASSTWSSASLEAGRERGGEGPGGAALSDGAYREEDPDRARQHRRIDGEVEDAAVHASSWPGLLSRTSSSAAPAWCGS